MAMPEEFKQKCRDFVAEYTPEYANPVLWAIEDEDHAALDKALDKIDTMPHRKCAECDCIAGGWYCNWIGTDTTRLVPA